MTIDDVVREALSGWADEARVPDRLADRALGKRRRNRIKAFAVMAGATAAVVAAALTVPTATQGMGGETSRVLTDGLIAGGPAIALAGPPELSTDPDAAVPAKLVATPEVAMYAYYVWSTEKISDKRQILTRTWYLYNPDTETYEKSPWASVAVAAGGYVAVLEDHQSRRVGILGPHGQVKWVDLEQPASSVEWSPDRKKLLLTSYASNPDEQGVVDENLSSEVVSVARTGFSVVDVESGQANFRPLASGDDVGQRNDLHWSHDGMLIWEHVSTPPLTKRFYDLEGSQQEAPPNVAGTHQKAGLSPSGRSLMIDSPDKGAIVAVKDVASGRTTPLKPVAGHWIEQSVAWSGEDNVITWACALKGVDNCEISEFRNRLLLVGADGRQAVPLTGFRENSQKPGSWEPLFAPR
ncbi:hypothetical protein ABZ297_17010 [Nonomuraea sp. NPDC005983]|uniref:hypothetical protein n=1 Tax=Nonomuraea sp. NPDC005983 TaxID=3155595 RepID=UPI00339E5A19